MYHLSLDHINELQKNIYQEYDEENHKFHVSNNVIVLSFFEEEEKEKKFHDCNLDKCFYLFSQFNKLDIMFHYPIYITPATTIKFFFHFMAW